jgi:alkaline phosphatase D
MWRWPARVLMLVMVLVSGGTVRAEDVVAGPMLGHVTEKSARVWLQLSTSRRVTVSYAEERSSQEMEVGMDVEGPMPFTCDLALASLKPNKNYRVDIRVDDKPVRVAQGLVIRTPPPAGEEATFSVAMGSGFDVHGQGSAPVFKAVSALTPRAFVFLGNTLTLPGKVEDYPQTHRAAVRFIADAYTKARQEPDLQPLFRTTPCYAIWNDHDFGVGDSNKDWVFKDEAWSVFQRFWPNPDWGTPENPGCYFTFTIGDVDFFMVDGRMYRDAESDPNRKTMLGEAQLGWLEKGLKESRATFKVIGCGSQLLADYGQGDTWAVYPEQREFLKWLGANRISGVMFVSGGRRVGEITGVKAGEMGVGYPLMEATSSGLGTAKDELPNGRRQGAAVVGPQFLTLDFGGVREHRFVTMRVRDEEGRVKLEQTVFAVQLK